MARKILIVDDDYDLRGELRDFLEGYEIVEASSGDEALRILARANEIGLIILDVMMPGVSGLDVLAEIKRTDPDKAIIILTGHSSKDVAIEALKSRADDYIEKPLAADKIQRAVERLMAKSAGNPDDQALDLRGKIEKVKRFVEMNCYKKISLEDAARTVYLSSKYLSRVFRQITGKGFSEYKLGIKMEKAKKFLSRSGFNVNQISDKLSYENTESFIRQFKKFTKLTPTEYRTRIKKKKAKKKRAR